MVRLLLYGTASALVFNKLFFPGFSEVAGTLAAFATFAAGFVVRPLGGVVFGHFGDRVGRRSTLMVSLLLMGGATVLMGLLPTYSAVNITAPVLLVVLRLVQGIAVGGEWGGAVLMAVEHAPARWRGFYGSWPQGGAHAGLVLATAAFGAFAALPQQQFLDWGWRVPFLLSALLLIVGLFVRMRLVETPDFARLRQRGARSRLPLLDVIQEQPGNVLRAFGACLAPFQVFYFFSVYVLTYATKELGIPRGTALLVVAIAACLEVLTIPAFAAPSDRIGRRAVFIGGAVAFAVLAYPYFLVVEFGFSPDVRCGERRRTGACASRDVRALGHPVRGNVHRTRPL